MNTKTSTPSGQALKLIAATALIAACGAISSQAARITWDFNDGTMQGWTNKMKSTSPALSFAPVYSFYGWSSSGDDGSAQPELGAFFLGQDSFVQNTHQTLWAESPAFTLDGTGDITFLAMGATNGGNLTNASYIPATSSAAGMCAVALRRDDGTFVITKHVTGDPGATFNQYTITAAELAPYLYDGHTYTIDVLDFYSGSVCSLIAVDNVSVPGVGAGMISFNFNDGTMQGWTNVMVSTAAAGYFDLSFGPAQQTGHDNWGGGDNAAWCVPNKGYVNVVAGWTQYTPSSMGAYFLGEVPFQGQTNLTDWATWPAASSGVQQTIMVQSPSFKINNSGPLTYLGCGSSQGVPLTTRAAIPAIAGTWNADSTAGSCAVGLLRDDGVFVLSQDFNQGDWSTYTFTATQLAPYVNDGHFYTLNMVDFWSGKNSWCAIDEVSIPGDILAKIPQQITGFGVMTNRTFGLFDLSTEFPNLAASSGLAVTLTVSGPATLTGKLLNVTNFGTVTVTAQRAGNAIYTAAVETQSFTVLTGPGPQAIFFDTIANQPLGSNYILTATASSGLPVTYTVSGAATLNGNILTFTNGIGAVTITAHQAGNASYNAAPNVSMTFTVFIPTNFGFETPALPASPGYLYQPQAASWTFENCGITTNGSPFTWDHKAPEGGQVAFLQGNGTFYQALDFLSNMTYRVTFQAREREQGNGEAGQTWDVLLDDIVLASYIRTDIWGGYSTYTTPTFKTTAGSHVLRFRGTNLKGGDNTILIDDVNIPSYDSLHGLTGEYYTNKDLTGLPTLTRMDPQIDFLWGEPLSPDALIPSTNYSIRWTGLIVPLYSETYTFYAAADDGVRLWVNDVLLVDQWIDQGETEYSGQIALQAGQKYTIKMEYYQGTGGAAARLRWSSPSTPKELIPQMQMLPTMTPPQPNPFTLKAMGGANGTFTLNLQGDTGFDYILQVSSSSLTNWTSLSTNKAVAMPMTLIDTAATNSIRFYRVLVK